jgi:threonine dehydratase
MMAMASIDHTNTLNQSLELDLWREATPIYRTSGHDGCHPLGLALSAPRCGFTAVVHMSKKTTLF